MPKEEKVELEGEVVEALPNAMFRVKLDNMDRVVLGHVAGKMRRFRIRILPGDRYSRIAGDIDQRECDQRHGERHQQRQAEPLQRVGQHGSPGRTENGAGPGAKAGAMTRWRSAIEDQKAIEASAKSLAAGADSKPLSEKQNEIALRTNIKIKELDKNAQPATAALTLAVASMQDAAMDLAKSADAKPNISKALTNLLEAKKKLDEQKAGTFTIVNLFKSRR